MARCGAAIPSAVEVLVQRDALELHALAVEASCPSTALNVRLRIPTGVTSSSTAVPPTRTFVASEYRFGLVRSHSFGLLTGTS